MTGTRNTLQLMAIMLCGTFAAHAAESAKTVVMLGDSTTLCSGNPPGAKLTDYVQTQLTQKHLQARLVNSGVGGDTAQGGLGRLQSAVFAHDPAVVTISFGLNDTGQLKPDVYQDSMEKIVQLVQSNTHARILLITSTPFNNKRHAWKDAFSAKGGLDEYMDANICAAERAGWDSL